MSILKVQKVRDREQKTTQKASHHLSQVAPKANIILWSQQQNLYYSRLTMSYVNQGDLFLQIEMFSVMLHISMSVPTSVPLYLFVFLFLFMFILPKHRQEPGPGHVSGLQTGSARHLYVVCINGAICLQIQNYFPPDPDIFSPKNKILILL